VEGKDALQRGAARVADPLADGDQGAVRGGREERSWCLRDAD